MVDKLIELLKGEFKVLHVEKWPHEDGSIDYSKKKGYYDIVLIGDRFRNNICRASVQDFRVISIEGSIFISGIDKINEALAALKESGDELD